MASLIDRVKNIIMSPKTEWQVIDGESGDTQEVFTYVAILAAIPAIIGLIFSLLLSRTLSELGISSGTIIVSTVLGYILTFVIIYAVAYLTDALAPTFGGEKHLPSALKLIAYSYTPLWVASIFSFVPLIGFLIVLAGLVYTIYVLYLGVPVMMRAPQDKTVGYTIVIIIGGIITGLVINYIAWALARIVA